MTSARWSIPADAMLAVARLLNEAFDGVIVATKIATGDAPRWVAEEGEGALGPDRLAVSLHYIFSRLNALHEVALAVAMEQPEVPRGHLRLH